MKAIFLFFFTLVYIYSMSLSLNIGEKNSYKYSILHVKDQREFTCNIYEQIGSKQSYICVFDGLASMDMSAKKTPFFSMSFEKKKNKSYMYIYPKYNCILKNMDSKLYKQRDVVPNENKYSKHYSFLFFKDDLLMPKQEALNGLDFPIFYHDNSLPSIGEIGLDGNPIDSTKTKDIDIFLDIQKAYHNGQYDIALDLMQKNTQEYPYNIFMSDIDLYRLNILDDMLDQNADKKILQFDRFTLIKDIKKWLREYSPNQNDPEVLMLLVKNYIQTNSSYDAKEFLDMLISGYPKDIKTQKAMLMYANFLQKNKQIYPAIKMYEDLFYKTNNVAIASFCALRLSRLNLQSNKVDLAKKYLDKIIKANEDFLYENRADFYSLAKEFEKKGLTSIAVGILDLLLEKASVDQNQYELVLKDAGLLHVKLGELDKAYEYFLRYQKEFSDGKYTLKVQYAIDKILYERYKNNPQKLDEYFKQIFARYKDNVDDDLLYKRAKFLLKHKKYDELLSLKDKKIIQNLKLEGAYLFVEDLLKTSTCKKAVNICKQYKSIVSKLNNKSKLYKCYMDLSLLKDAENLALTQTKTVSEERLLWLVRLRGIYFAQKRLQKALEISEVIEEYGEGVDRVDLAFYERFFALMELKRYKDALKMASKIEKTMPKNSKNIRVYESIINSVDEKRHDILVVSYMKKILSIDDKIYKDNLELWYKYIRALQNLKRFDEAKGCSLRALKLDLDKNEKSRAFYVIAEAYFKLKDLENSKKYFQKCVKLGQNNQWSKICKENLDLM